MKVYSPTSTEAFARCPVYARLHRTWEPRGMEWTPNMLLGRAIGDGMSHHYREMRNGRESTVSPLDLAMQVLREGYVPQETYTLDGLGKYVRAGLKEAIETSPVRGPILFVDEPLESGSRPDVVYRHPSGGLSIADTKVKLKVSDWQRRNKYVLLEEYETWWQGFHYAWEVGEQLGEPVKWIGPHLITLTPKPEGQYHPVEVTPQRVAFWLRQAKVLWAQMDLGVEYPNWFSCRGKFGRCEFMDACHVLDLDEDKMAILYQKKLSR